MRRRRPAPLVLWLGMVALALFWHSAGIAVESGATTLTPPITSAGAAERLAAALRHPTISIEAGQPPAAEAFDALHAQLRADYPRLHAVLAVETVNVHSLLLTWAGQDAHLPPALLLAHLDVVPVVPGSEGLWTHPPFAGVIADGYIWGRGALDDKASALAQLEAVEALLAEGWQPQRTLIFAFGHDEEIGGREGARGMAARLKERGVQAAFLLDEGGGVLQGVVPGIERPVAMLMTGEKGYLSLRLRAEDVGGHSSMPPRLTAAGRVARAVERVQSKPPAARLTPPVIAMLEAQAPELPLVQRLAIRHRWLFEPLLLRALDAGDSSRALIRTTVAPTRLTAGVKDNVLPPEAEAVINFRLLPGDSLDGIEAHVRRVIDDPAVTIQRSPFASEASRVTPVSDPHYRLIADTIRAVYPEALVSTGLVVGATDARHYDAVAAARFNFLPVRLNAADLKRIHGHDERLAVAEYETMIQFYTALFRRL